MTKEELFSVFKLIGFNKIEKNIHNSLPISMFGYNDLKILLYEALNYKLQETTNILKELYSITIFSENKLTGDVVTIYKVDVVDPNFKLKENISISTNSGWFKTKKEFLDYLISYGFVYIKSNLRLIKLGNI